VGAGLPAIDDSGYRNLKSLIAGKPAPTVFIFSRLSRITFTIRSMSEPQLELNKPISDEVKQTTCYMCACRCGINVHIKDGQVRYIEGNPAHPVNRGVLCAKGSAGIMQHYSPARLRKPLLRVGERGAGDFKEIEWEEALSLATTWLGDARAKDPNRLAFFTGRDQSQALTGWWAQQYGTVNYAAHGGFCSVNMAAGGLYTLGGSFWEFGEPDWDHAQIFMLWGVAEDHDSNPIKLGLGKLKARGAKIIAVNPVRTGYGAVADEWIGIRPGTDGLFAFALIHECLKNDWVDLDYLVRYTNAHYLVIQNLGGEDDGVFARDDEGRVLCAINNSLLLQGEGGRRPDEGASVTSDFKPADATNISPRIIGEYVLPDGRKATPVFNLLAARYLDEQYSPENVSERCGIPTETIKRIAKELADAAFKSNFSLPIAWTDVHGNEHQEMIGRPVAMHAMRGISAHSNGFHTCRALHVLQMLLGAIDSPGSFRYQPPFPRPIPPANRPGKNITADGKLDAPPLGFVHGPEDLVVDANGNPRRIDHAYSWAYPLAAHGMMHTVIRNAHDGNPYPIDVLMMFMANMSWNSTMNTKETMGWLTAKNDNGDYKIPKIIYSDAYSSEMVAYADLILPDTTYLERFDAISMLDRPISDADCAADAIRHPVFQPDRDVRGFQSVLIDIGARLKLPALLDEYGEPKYRDFEDYILNHERAPGVGLLAGWRGEHGELQGKGQPNPDQLEQYKKHGGFWHQAVPENARYYKMANRDYLQWATMKGFIVKPDQVVLQLYSETLQKFRLAAQGHGEHQPPAQHRERVEKYFDPMPIWYEPFEGAELAETQNKNAVTPAKAGAQKPNTKALNPNLPHDDHFPLSAITQRPPFMYHSWGSQNAWLRQIATRNYLYLHPATANKYQIEDLDWVHVDSHQGRITVQCKFATNMQPDTVWTWNAIGKRKGAWALAKNAPESSKGFLINHLISDITPKGDYANADPVTGQAAWFDLRVRIEKAVTQDQALPNFDAINSKQPGDNSPLRYGIQFRKKS
jgi:sulfite dehydrogenase (quinone) subunit SoeA